MIVFFIVRGMSILLKFVVIKRIEVVFFEIVIKYFVKLMVDGNMDVIEIFKMIVFVYSLVWLDLLYCKFENCDISMVDFIMYLVMLSYSILEGFRYFDNGIDVSFVRVKLF